MQIMNNIRSCANCRIKQSEKRKIDNFYIKARECRGLNIRVCFFEQNQKSKQQI